MKPIAERSESITLSDYYLNHVRKEIEHDVLTKLLQEFPGEQYDLVERVKDLIERATGERPI